MPRRKIKRSVVEAVLNMPIELVAERFGFRPKVTSTSRLKFLCFFHKEKTASLVITKNTGLYYCFGCHSTGNVIDLVCKLRGCTFRQAVLYLATKLLGMKVKDVFGKERLDMQGSYKNYFLK